MGDRKTASNHRQQKDKLDVKEQALSMADGLYN
jgi:hypothetical protein